MADPIRRVQVPRLGGLMRPQGRDRRLQNDHVTAILKAIGVDYEGNGLVIDAFERHGGQGQQANIYCIRLGDPTLQASLVRTSQSKGTACLDFVYANGAFCCKKSGVGWMFGLVNEHCQFSAHLVITSTILIPDLRNDEVGIISSSAFPVPNHAILEVQEAFGVRFPRSSLAKTQSDWLFPMNRREYHVQALSLVGRGFARAILQNAQPILDRLSASRNRYLDRAIKSHHAIINTLAEEAPDDNMGENAHVPPNDDHGGNVPQDNDVGEPLGGGNFIEEDAEFGPFAFVGNEGADGRTRVEDCEALFDDSSFSHPIMGSPEFLEDLALLCMTPSRARDSAQMPPVLSTINSPQESSSAAPPGVLHSTMSTLDDIEDFSTSAPTHETPGPRVKRYRMENDLVMSPPQFYENASTF